MHETNTVSTQNKQMRTHCKDIHIQKSAYTNNTNMDRKMAIMHHLRQTKQTWKIQNETQQRTQELEERWKQKWETQNA